MKLTTKLKKKLSLIKRFVTKASKSDSYKVVRYLSLIFNDEFMDNSSYFRKTVYDAKVFKIKGGFHVELHTTTPGVLIGRRGQTIDQIKSYLERFTEKKIEISIVECKLYYCK